MFSTTGRAPAAPRTRRRGSGALDIRVRLTKNPRLNEPMEEALYLFPYYDPETNKYPKVDKETCSLQLARVGYSIPTATFYADRFSVSVD